MWKLVWLNRMAIPSATIAAGTLAAAEPSRPAPQPGTLNAFTGEVWLDGTPVGPISAGRVNLEPGRAVTTGKGMAELLLRPGSFLRLGMHSEMTLEAVRRSEIRIRLRNGEALLEILDLQNPIVLEQNGTTAIVRKPGLYDFDEKRAMSAIYAGEAQFARNDKQFIAHKGFGVRTRSLREFQTSPDPRNTLLAWSKTRAEQLSSESVASAQTYAGGAGRWQGPAWFWDPWSASYTFLSASGVVTGPFGWPYYSPGYAPNSIPVHPRGDSWLYGPPVQTSPRSAPTAPPGPGSRKQGNPTPTVPLTAPGVPQFPNNRF